MIDDLERMDRWIVLPRPDRRPIYEWAKEHVVLPDAYAIKGAFDVRTSPWLIAPFDSMKDARVRRTTVSKAVQSGGTLLAEITTLWRFVNDPGPTTFTFQSDEMAGIQAKTRMNPLMENCEPVKRMLPDKGPMNSTQQIYFGGFFFIMNSANLAHQQSQSIRYKLNDELWAPKWADVYQDACARVTAFEQQGTSHILDISQGGVEGDWAEWSFAQGSQEEWTVICANKACAKAIALWIDQHMKDDPDTRAGLVWAKEARREDGTFDEVLASETAHFVCPHCGHAHEDSDATREHWRKTGHYVSAKENPPKDWRSFHWEALVAHPMRLLALEFCRAENHFHRMGDAEPRKKFKQKRQARSWIESKAVIELGAGAMSDYAVSDYDKGQLVPVELMRSMSIDKQDNHWWVEVGAWTTENTGSVYRQLFFGRAETRDQLRALQAKYGVADGLVGQDRGFKPSDVDLDCVNYGWNGLAGDKSGTRRWPVRDEATGQIINFPYSPTYGSPVAGRGDALYVVFAGDYMKDVFSNAIQAKGGLSWKLPKDVNPLYLEHIKGESKQEIKPGQWKWIETKSNVPNHGLDTSVMQLVIAMVRGIVKFDEKKG